MAHTPGPWKIRKANRPVDGAYDFAVGAEIDDGGPYCIAEAYGRAAEEVWLPAEDNARLIAAAPALLEALEEAIVELRECTEELTGEDYNNPKFNAIIAAARGE